MQQCSFLDDSSRFSKLVYGGIVLIAFLVRSKWLVLIISILMFLSACSLSFNIAYQIYIFIKNDILKKKIEPVQKEPGELRFSYAMAGMLIFIGFLLLQFTKYTAFAWIYILIVAFMLFIACFVGFCVAILLYVAFKKFLLKAEIIRNKQA
jgi:phosphate/sulfate permease